jgi:hypothetical protein
MVCVHLNEKNKPRSVRVRYASFLEEVVLTAAFAELTWRRVPRPGPVMFASSTKKAQQRINAYRIVSTS